MSEQHIHTIQDERIEKAIRLIQKLSSESSEAITSEISDAISALHALNEDISVAKENKIRLNHLIDLMLKYTVLDYSEQAPISEKGDELDALSAGLNALMEEIIYSSKIIQDKITQLNEAQRLTHIGSWEWNIASNKIEWSDELYRIYGVDPNTFEASYENYLACLHPDDREFVNNAIQQAYQDHQPFAFVHKIIRNNVERMLDCTGFVSLDEEGNLLSMTGTAQDVTERRKIEEEKLKAEQEKQAAIDALKYKQQFLSNMSHEIRTPLTAIIGFTKVVLNSELNAKQREYLNAIKVSGDALLMLVNDILDLAKVNAGKMTFDETPFNIKHTINNMLLLFEIKIHQKNIKLINRYDDNIPETLVGDPARLNQIILNLVSNAIKFTSKGSITVDVRLIDETDEHANINFSISDTGIGIEPENLERIFDTFQQASSETSRIFGGTGLGLAIVKQLVNAQGGDIEVKSVVNEGSTFTFNLNFKKSEIKATLEKTPIEQDEIYDHENEIHVLVVEDIALNQLLMKVVLTNMGFKLDIAGNGKEAIEKLKENIFDIVLMDLHMPIMDGFEATEIIRNNMQLTVPIIALTADVTTADIQKSRLLGMNDYATKPIDPKKLYSQMISVLKKSNKIPR